MKFVGRFRPPAEQRELARLWTVRPDVPTTTTLLGPEVRVAHPRVFASQFQAIFVREQYRFSSVAPDPRILDCGANIGLASVYWKRLFPKARITGFEADPRLAQAARRTLADCGMVDVEIVAAAIATRDGPVAFEPTGADTGRMTAGGPSAITVPGVRLRTLLDDPVALLKVDVEGAETDVLLDCADGLSQVENLFVEYHSFALAQQRFDELLATLRNAGMRYHIVPELVAEQPFLDVPTYAGMDMTLNVFAFRGPH